MIGALLFAACVTVASREGGTDSGLPPTADTADTAPPWWDEPRSDVDADGYRGVDGDCDDLRADAFPGAPDETCDGVDQDCDGAPDDGHPGDAFEPNDTSPTPLGDFGEGGEALVLSLAFPEGDTDTFSFRVEDGDFALFDVEAWVYGVPSGVDLSLSLVWETDADGVYRGVVAETDAGGPGEDELLEWGGQFGEDDGGEYTLHVSARGADCAQSYLLQLLVGSW